MPRDAMATKSSVGGRREDDDSFVEDPLRPVVGVLGGRSVDALLLGSFVDAVTFSVAAISFSCSGCITGGSCSSKAGRINCGEYGSLSGNWGRTGPVESNLLIESDSSYSGSNNVSEEAETEPLLFSLSTTTENGSFSIKAGISDSLQSSYDGAQIAAASGTSISNFANTLALEPSGSVVRPFKGRTVTMISWSGIIHPPLPVTFSPNA
mmetsp:Transcript_4718/g.8683  ORF Transcript_4718/g.8683 Transcript_4718/m.8683 type:complete len:209 (-) Transcript_4718:1030-1656(-)